MVQDASTPLTVVQDAGQAMPVEQAATVPHMEDCGPSNLPSNLMIRDAPTAEDQAHETSRDPATALPPVGDRRVPNQVVRDAREALTTAGYNVHEARAAVERALAQLDEPVTLPQLIRQALRCCAIARG
jgi:hypothetical protein